MLINKLTKVNLFKIEGGFMSLFNGYTFFNN